MNQRWLPVRLALQFLTCFPVGQTPEATQRQLGASVSWYPFVGLIIGCVLVGVVFLTTQLFGSQLSAALVLCVWIASTGALHLDGLADCADAWVGGMGSRARTLALLKEPTCGAMAVTAVVVILILKFAALTEWLSYAMSAASPLWMFTLILPPFVGRISAVVLMAVTPLAQQKGLGWAVSRAMSRKHVACWLLLWGTVLVLFLAMLDVVFSPLNLFLLSLFPFFPLWMMRSAALTRLGGYTGDVVGATVDWVELSVLLGWVAVMRGM